MKNVSNEFKNIIKSGGPFFSYATVVLADGTSLTLDSYDDFSDDGNSYSESGGDGFPLGVALSKQITINLENTDGRFSEYDFYGAIFTAYTEADLPDVTTERIPEGIFTVIDSVAPGDVLEITAYDNMYKLDSPFSSKLNYPATLQQMWNELCSYYDLTNGSPSFANNDFTVTSAPTDITGRELAGYIAQMAIGNAIVDKNGRLCIKSYDFTLFDDMKIISGGVFGDNVSDSIAGGVFGDGLSSSVSGGTFESLSGYHLLSDFINDPDISTDDVKITGIQTTVRNEEDDEYTVLIYGTDEYALSISNPLITGKEQTAISMIGDALIGVTVRPFSGSFSPNPTIEFMDLVYVVDKKDNIYASFVTDNNFEYLGNSDISNGLEPPERNRSTYSGNATEVYRRVQQQINNQKNDFETAVDNLENQLQNASGLYETDETQPDGSTIYYFHNKPTLGGSDTIIKITSQALGISTDGGESYPVGITVDGEAIVSILQTVGINADWITTGAIQVSDDDGNIIFSVNMDTKQIIISGESVQIGGKPAPDALNDILQESKDYSDGKLADFANTVTENIENLQNQVDGQIGTYYEDYEPSLQNYPANEWTTTEERQKHEGDLFFWKSKGYAYRFFQDGATWKWQMVQDTDITSALAAAEKAQDTADGKRRVFVVTPQPPYDIGDLWCNGEDILTCSTARPQGSPYVSSDWEKLNSYTDDTLANEALEEARQARNLNIILDNEYQGIPADYEGNIGTFPEVKTFVQVLYGHTDVSTDCIYAITKSNSVTGSWDNAARTYTVTGLSEDTGWVDITASYLSLFTTTKRFNVQKVKDGAPGEDGETGPAGADGSDGNGIKSITNYYLATTASSGVTTSTSGWTTTIQTITTTKKYLWNYEKISYTNGSTTSTTPCIIGVYGNTGATGPAGADGTDGKDGATGNGISSIVEHYAVSTSNTTAPTSWSTTVPTMTTTNRYLWNYETINYTNGTSVNTSKRVIGVYGNTGATGPKGDTGATGPAGADGSDGATGAPGRTYMIEPSVNVLKRASDNSIAPDFIEFNAYYRDGNSATRTAYAGRWIIEETADGDDWTTIYTSSANESSVTHYLYSMLADSDGSAIANANGDTIGIPRDIVAIRAKLYAAGGTTNLLDMQSVVVVIDVSGLTQEEIFNLLTNNGEAQGIYQEGNQLYINASFVKSGILSIGGNGNKYGELYVYSENEKRFLSVNKNGFLCTVPSYSGDLNFSIYPGEYGGYVRVYKNLDSRYTDLTDGSIGTYDVGESGKRTSRLNYNQLSFEKIEYDSDGNQTGYKYVNLSPELFQMSGTKSRIIQTEYFENVLQYCYEMPTPFFGDIGSGKLDKNGTSYIDIEEIFKSTINTENCTYYVFLQKEGEGEIWVEEKNQNYFVVKGTPGLNFSWEIKARQREYEELRLDKFEKPEEEKDIDYAAQGIETLTQYINNMEGTII